jgi:threonine/homoserine/homoserine lactone efflux protein
MTFSTILIPYLLALTTVYITPGPDMMLIMTVSSVRGSRAGVSVAIGFGTARFIHVFASGLGMAALFTLYPAVSVFMRILGAGYLLLLAFLMVRNNNRKKNADMDKAITGTREKEKTLEEIESISQIDKKRASFFHGFITNLLNPKALIFCSMLLPQFVYSQSQPLLMQFFILGSILVFAGFSFDLLYALLSEKISRLLSQTGRKNGRDRKWYAMRKAFAPLMFSLLALYLMATIGV